MKKISTLLLLLFAQATFAQSPEKVKAMELALDTLEGTELVRKYSTLAYIHAFRDMPKAYSYGQTAIALADASDDFLAKSTAYRNMGIVYAVDANGDSALYFFQKSMDFAQILGSDQEIGMCTNNLGMYHWNQGNLTKAIDFFMNAYALSEKINDQNGVGRALNNICLIFNELNQADKGLPYCEKALEIRRQINDTLDILQTINNVGIALLDLGQTKESLIYFDEGLTLSQYAGYESMLDEFYTGLATAHFQEGNYLLARSENLKSIDLLIEADDLYTIHKHYATAAEIENQLKNYSKAVNYAKKGLVITDSLEISAFNAMLYSALAEGYFGLGKNDFGMAAMRNWNAAKDSTFSKNNAEAIAQKEVEYETQKKEQQILLQQTELERQSTQNKLLLTGALAGFLLLSIGFILWRNRSRLLKQKELQAVEIKARNDQFMAVLAAEEKERQRLARDLHDGLGQVLSTARMNVSALEDAPLPKEDEAILNNSIALIDRAVNEMRNVSHDLMPRVLSQSGLIAALKEIRDKVNQSQQFKMTVSHEVDQLSLPKEKEIILYRILQEIVNNVVKHSGAKEIDLTIKAEGKNYRINVSQNKGRVEVEKLERGNGIGWMNIKSRLALINGNLHILPLGADGMQFNLTIPK